MCDEAGDVDGSGCEPGVGLLDSFNPLRSPDKPFARFPLAAALRCFDGVAGEMELIFRHEGLKTASSGWDDKILSLIAR